MALPGGRKKTVSPLLLKGDSMSRMNTPSLPSSVAGFGEDTAPSHDQHEDHGAPTKLNTALRGTPANRTTKSARSATVAPVKTTGPQHGCMAALDPRCPYQSVASPNPEKPLDHTKPSPKPPRRLLILKHSRTAFVRRLPSSWRSMHPWSTCPRLLLALQDQSTAGVKAQT